MPQQAHAMTCSVSFLKKITAGLTLFVLAGCATRISTEPFVLDGQEKIFRDGVPALVSKKKAIVMVSPLAVVRNGSEQPKFVVSVANTTDRSFDLDTTNVEASVDGKNIKVFTFEEVAEQIKSRQAWAAFAVALGGAMQAASAQRQASYSSNYGTYNSYGNGTVNTYGSRSNQYGSYTSNTYGTYSGWSYNPAAGQAAAAQVNARTDAQLESLAQQGNAALSEAARNILKRTTVMPSTSYGGQVVLAVVDVPKSGNTLDLAISVAGEVHIFKFVQDIVKR